MEAGLRLSQVSACLKHNLQQLTWPLGALEWSAELRD